MCDSADALPGNRLLTKGTVQAANLGPSIMDEGLDSKLIFHVAGFFLAVGTPQEGGRMCCTNTTHSILSVVQPWLPDTLGWSLQPCKYWCLILI